MPVIKNRDLRRQFEAKGASKRGGAKHDKYVFIVGHEVLARTSIPRGRRDLKSPLVAAIAGQLGLDSGELVQVANCEIDSANLAALLVARRPIDDQRR